MNRDRILIVDDEADIALILKLQLEDAGYRTVRAKDGVDALERMDREPFDLVLLDIKMPRMDGIQVLDRIRGEARTEAVIMMTAHGNEDIAVDSLKKGALDYIAKPFSTEDIVIKVDHAIRFNRTRLENRKLEQKLEEERRKTETILQGMADLLIAVDQQGSIVTVNRAVEEFLGKSRDALVGRPMADAVKADIPPEQLPGLDALRTAAPCLNRAYTICLADRNVPVLASATPLFNSGGELSGAVEIIRDISRLKALEQDKEDFVTMLSHDLKTPITSIVGSLDLVREGRLGTVNEEQKTFLESAVESCDEMVEMIDTLLDVYKFEAGKMKLAFHREDPRLLITRILSKFESVTRHSGHRLSAVCEEPLPEIRVERSKFSRLLNNILSNAIKFTPEGGEIELRAGRASGQARVPEALYSGRIPSNLGNYLQISVRDGGIGIPSDALEMIFDRYEQAKSRGVGKTRGTGLGLAFCRKVMDAHNGFIWAESTEGHGSTFFLLFPLD
jgi:PAS domain S-box-containing protein